MSDGGFSRREFLSVSGGLGVGLVLSFSLPGSGRAEKLSVPETHELNAWIRVATDDSVYLSVSKLEMGQGVFTSIPMVLAEELEVDWGRIRAEQAPADARFGRQQTGGSSSIRVGFDAYRRAGAAAREMLVEVARAEWGAERAECSVEQGVVVHAPSGRRLRYGELAARAAALTPPENVK